MNRIVENYNPFDKMTFTYDKCFLCGCKLTNDNKTDEHIYPKWLQNMFNLWDKELGLINKTRIKYRYLKIPCCKLCNEKMGELFEKPLERAVSSGYNEIISLDRHIIFLWLIKLSYGMLFKELSLNINQNKPESGKIFSTESLKECRMQYMFLQTILSNATYKGKPYSMLIFKINPCDEEKYWASDHILMKTFFIRMNDIGIITHLMDNGVNENHFLQFPEFNQLLKKTLHPIQFAELCAKFLYKTFLLYRNPSYLMHLDDNQKPEMIISLGMTGYGYDKWSQKDYATLLSYFWERYGLKFEDIYQGDDKVLTYLFQQDGMFNDMINN